MIKNLVKKIIRKFAEAKGPTLVKGAKAKKFTDEFININVKHPDGYYDRIVVPTGKTLFEALKEMKVPIAGYCNNDSP